MEQGGAKQAGRGWPGPRWVHTVLIVPIPAAACKVPPLLSSIQICVKSHPLFLKPE